MVTLYFLNVQFSRENYKTYKGTRKCVLYIEKNSQPIETVPEEVQMLDLLDKNINSVIINMFKELTKAMFKE